MSGGQTEKQSSRFMDFKPVIIMFTPSYSLVIAECSSASATQQEEISLVGHLRRRAVGEGMRSGSSASWYRMPTTLWPTEVMGPWWPANASRPRTVRDRGNNHFYPEIIDP
jgi:phenylacetate-CoA ligase